MPRRAVPPAPPGSVSVVVPSFNGAQYLEQALRSALEQDPPPLEILVQDGGSTDATADVVAALGDPRVTFTQEPDAGQSDALNRAISRARGEWICWLNVDDLLYPGLFAEARQAADADLVYGDFAWIDEQDRTLRVSRPGPEFTAHRLLADGCFAFSGAMLIRRSALARVGPIDADLHMAMDYDLYLRLAPTVRARYVPRMLGAFRVHGASKTSGLTWEIFTETVRVRRRHGGYGAATRRPVLVNQAKQLVDLATLPVRRRLGWR